MAFLAVFPEFSKQENLHKLTMCQVIRQYQNHLMHKLHCVSVEQDFVHIWMGYRGDNSNQTNIYFAPSENEGEDSEVAI